MGQITSANSILMLSANRAFNVPVQIQGFAADDVFDAESIDSSETSMGVDGILSAGFVHVPVKWGITLQADSASMVFFDTLYSIQKQLQEVLQLQGVLTLPAIGTSWTLTNGFMTSYKPMPDGKRVLQSRKFVLTWESIQPVPVA